MWDEYCFVKNHLKGNSFSNEYTEYGQCHEDEDSVVQVEYPNNIIMFSEENE